MVDEVCFLPNFSLFVQDVKLFPLLWHSIKIAIFQNCFFRWNYFCAINVFQFVLHSNVEKEREEKHSKTLLIITIRPFILQCEFLLWNKKRKFTTYSEIEFRVLQKSSMKIKIKCFKFKKHIVVDRRYDFSVTLFPEKVPP